MPDYRSAERRAAVIMKLCAHAWPSIGYNSVADPAYLEVIDGMVCLPSDAWHRCSAPECAGRWRRRKCRWTSNWRWLQAHNPNAAACWVAGFSFGAWIGMQLLMRRPEISSFISISPPANMYDFSFLAPCPSSGLVIQGDEDDIVPAESVNKLVQKLSNQRDINIDYRLVEGANHFFHDKLDELTGEIDDYLAGPSKPKRAKAAAR